MRLFNILIGFFAGSALRGMIVDFNWLSCATFVFCISSAIALNYIDIKKRGNKQ